MRFLRLLLLVFALAPLALAAADEEKIVDYHSDIAVQPDASLLVTESIRVHSLGRAIQHGIYRDFPTDYFDSSGRHVSASFRVLEVQRDGRSEPYRVGKQGNGWRVYAGSSETWLPAGDYVYTIRYRASGELGFFSDHDELYWNVTGNAWKFPIEHASASVHLPALAASDAVRYEAYTGQTGSKVNYSEARVEDANTIAFSTTRAQPQFEGFTVVVTWPKGLVRAPSGLKHFGDRTLDLAYVLRPLAIGAINHPLARLGGVGVGVVFLYLLVVWLMVGVDPRAGTIVPQYEAPPGFSPAAVRYLTKMAFDNKTLAAALVNMAVKKYLTIKKEGTSYTLTRAAQPGGGMELSPEEKVIAGNFFAEAETFTLSVTENQKIRETISSFNDSLKTKEEKKYFFTNSGYLLPAVLLALGTVAVTIARFEVANRLQQFFIAASLTMWSLAVVGLTTLAAKAWRSLLFGTGGGRALGQGLMASLFALVFLATDVLVFPAIATPGASAIALVMGAFILLLVVFGRLLEAPTRAGRAVLDKIDGFKMFLGATEKDRLDKLYSVERTPAVFEKFLPYAVALDVEDAWSAAFAGAFAMAAAAGSSGTSTYSPAWYSGNISGDSFASSFSSSLTSSIASSATPPGSSSGSGGGGSSGGGGGGGGGGGW